jgi:RNA polymerase sigma-70 factor (ECF subfamily)
VAIIREIPGTLGPFGRNSVEQHMGSPERRPDRDLLLLFRDGDREAFSAVYRAHFPAVFRFAFYMTGDRILAGEITQDVFVWLVHHSGDFDAERGELGAFLGGVARKFLHRRQQTERRWLPLDEAAISHREASGGTEFARGLERRQDLAELRKAIAALPERYREAVVLCDLQEKSYEQAAEELGCALGTVRSRLHRARELLVRKFQWKRESQKC